MKNNLTTKKGETRKLVILYRKHSFYIISISKAKTNIYNGGYSSIGRTAVCGTVYSCSSQGIHPLFKYIFNSILNKQKKHLDVKISFYI